MKTIFKLNAHPCPRCGEKALQHNLVEIKMSCHAKDLEFFKLEEEHVANGTLTNFPHHREPEFRVRVLEISCERCNHRINVEALQDNGHAIRRALQEEQSSFHARAAIQALSPEESRDLTDLKEAARPHQTQGADCQYGPQIPGGGFSSPTGAGKSNLSKRRDRGNAHNPR